MLAQAVHFEENPSECAPAGRTKENRQIISVGGIFTTYYGQRVVRIHEGDRMISLDYDELLNRLR